MKARPQGRTVEGWTQLPPSWTLTHLNLWRWRQMARLQGGTNTAPPKLDTHSPEPLAVGAEDKAAGWDSSTLDTAPPMLDIHLT